MGFIFRNLILIFSIAANGFFLIHWVKNRPEKVVAAEKVLPVTVAVAPVITETISRNKIIPGTIYAQKSASVISDIHGRIKSILFKKGQKVKKGQKLIQLYDEKPFAELREAQARAKAAQASLKRQKSLGDLSSASALEKAQAEYEVALAHVAKTEAELKSTLITAPFDGVIGLMTLTEGAQVNPNQELTKIVSEDGFSVQFQVGEAESRYLKVGQNLDVWATEYDKRPAPAKITAIEPYSNQVSHQVKIEALITLDSAQQIFHDGSYARVELPLEQRDEVLTIPKESIIRENDESFVYILMPSGNKITLKRVIAGMTQGDRTEAKEGLKEGDQVVLDPQSWPDYQPVNVETMRANAHRGA